MHHNACISMRFNTDSPAPARTLPAHGPAVRSLHLISPRLRTGKACVRLAGTPILSTGNVGKYYDDALQSGKKVCTKGGTASQKHHESGGNGAPASPN
jgi:hypothetical protein